MRNTRWIAIVVALVLVTITAAIAYNVGLEQGGGEPVAGHHHGHGPWGFPFFLAPLFFVFLWLAVLRGFAGRCRGRHGHRRGCRDLDDWHRQAHERMWNEPDGDRTPGGAATR
jgi:hypothetical protein